jgi:hypothetical protein
MDLVWVAAITRGADGPKGIRRTDMARFLFTMILSDDIGIPARCLPIALELKRRGHMVAFCNPREAPAKFIGGAGVDNLPIDVSTRPTVCSSPTPELWNLDHFMCIRGYVDEQFVRARVRAFVEVIESFAADVVVDSWEPTACMAARACRRCLVTIIQADIHPTNRGFMWWKEPPDDIPSPVAAFNAVLLHYGLAPISTSSELVVGDLTLCAGTPETDPVPGASDVVHMGPMFSPHMQAQLPGWIDDFAGDTPLIWVYCGNPRYHGAHVSGIADSIVVLQAAYAGLADQDVRVIVTAGYQARPKELPPLPSNFREADFLPGLSLARRCDFMVHHGGHSSCMTGTFAGTPALIIPTFSERESNARRLANLGVASLLIPVVDASGSKHVDSTAFRDTVRVMLTDASYRKNAEELARRMANYGGPDRIADITQKIEGLL